MVATELEYALMSDAVSKRCNRCNEVDVTDFSTCKSCGQKYDVPKYKAPSNNAPLIIVIVIVALGAGVWTCRDSLYKAVTSSLTGNQGTQTMLDKPPPKE
jgi:hypothetical protein